MSITLDELVARVITSISLDAYSDDDIRSLIEVALNQRSTIERLAADVERLTDSIAQAGERLTEMETTEGARSTTLTVTNPSDSIHHLVQYAEESSLHNVG